MTARPIAILLATFAVGLAAGLGLAPLLRPPPPPPPHRGAPLPPGLAELDLRPDQRAAITAIIDRHGPEAEALMAGALPRLRELQERVAAEIDLVLDPAQRTRLRHARATHPPPR